MLSKRFLDKNPLGTILVVVPTEYLKNQWLDLIDQWSLNIDVMVINTAIKQVREYTLLIIDEIHTTPSDCMSQVFTCIKYKCILGLTGTLDRLDGKEELIKRYCPVVDQVDMNEAIEKGWLSSYTEYKVVLDVDLEEYQRYNIAFNQAFTVFEYDFNLAMKCATNYHARLDYVKQCCIPFTNNPKYRQLFSQKLKEVSQAGKQFMGMMKLRKQFSSEHPYKLDIARRILKYRSDKKIITFSPSIEMAESIDGGDVYHSKLGKKKKTEVMERFNSCTSGVLHTAKALDAGMDVQGLNTSIILSNTSSSIQKRQRNGRILRFAPNKHAEVFTLVIKGTNEEGWFQSSSKGLNYEEINESQLDQLLKTGSYERNKKRINF